MLKTKFKKDINDKLQTFFIFTKDTRDIVDYKTITRVVEDMDLSAHQLGYHLKYNYCMPIQKHNVYYYNILDLLDLK